MKGRTIYVFFLVLFSIKMFDAVIANSGILKNVCYGYMAFTIFISLPYFFNYRGGFVLPIQILCISIFISIFMSQYTWGQNLSYAGSTLPYLIWFAFFYLKKRNFPIEKIETIVIIYGVIYILLFLFQFSHTSVVYFGYHESFKEDRGIVRVNFPGAGVFFLSCFIAVNKSTNFERKKKFLWIIYSFIGIVIIILQVTRQSILCMCLFYLVHFLRNVKLGYKIAIFLTFIFAGYIFLNSGLSISEGLVNQQKQDASAGKDYIRLLSAEYFLTDFTPNIVSKIFGNGFYNNGSNYGKIMTDLGQNYGFFVTDIGIIEIYVLFGIFSVIAYLIIFVKSITFPLPLNYYYLKYYLWMIMLTAFTSDSLISPSFNITTVFVLYIYQRLYEQRRAKVANHKLIYNHS